MSYKMPHWTNATLIRRDVASRLEGVRREREGRRGRGRGRGGLRYKMPHWANATLVGRGV
jgi:hypothetical protein